MDMERSGQVGDCGSCPPVPLGKGGVFIERGFKEAPQ